MATGDHIYVHYTGFTNHGIDCGGGTVTYYSELNNVVSQTSKAGFSAGKPVYVKEYGICDSPTVVLGRAESRLGENDYSLWENNCEHFATWCKTGKSASEQVKNANATTTGAITSSLAPLGGGLGIVSATSALAGFSGAGISFFDLLKQLKEQNVVSADKADALVKRIEDILTYQPCVGVFGKTGTGKSSLCNALFGAEISEISDVVACTRNPQEVLVQIGAGGIKLIDCPGVGENTERDKEYQELYEQLLPKLDLILWLVKADDRALSSDQEFFDKIIQPNLNGKPLFIVLSQVDKIEPIRNWDEENRIPGKKQQENIDKKVAYLAEFFNLSNTQVIPVCAQEEYNLIYLVDKIVFALPNDRKVSFAKAVKDSWRSEKAQREAEDGFAEEILQGMQIVCPKCKALVKIQRDGSGKWVGRVVGAAGGGGLGYAIGAGLGIAGGILGAPIAIPAGLAVAAVGAVIGALTGEKIAGDTLVCSKCGHSWNI